MIFRAKVVRLLAHTFALGAISEGSEEHRLHWAKKGRDGDRDFSSYILQGHLLGFISGFALPRKQSVLDGQRDRALASA